MERLSDDQIKAGLLHQDIAVRFEALQYFEESCTRDESIMPLVIEALKRFGRVGAFDLQSGFHHLPQTEATVRWAVEELGANLEEEEGGQSIYFERNSEIFCQADPRLVLPFKDAILGSKRVAAPFAETLSKRLEIMDWDGESLWRELKEICVESMEANEDSDEDVDEDLDEDLDEDVDEDVDEDSDEDLDEDSDETREWEAEEIAEALARQGETHIARMMEILETDVENEDELTLWMQAPMVLMAGVMRYEPAATAIVKVMDWGAEYEREQGLMALVRIGSDLCVQVLKDAFAEGDWEFRLYAIGALSRIHRDGTTSALLELLQIEEDEVLRAEILEALPAQYSRQAMDAACEYLEKGEGTILLCDRMAACGALMGIEFPQLEQAKERIHALIKQEGDDNFARLQKANDLEPAPEPYTPAPERPFMRLDDKVGRNDPCPCGSGKKFKKCCIGKR